MALPAQRKSAMKKTAVLTLVLCLALTFTGLCQDAELDLIVDRLMKGSKVIGGSVVVYINDGMVYAHDYGLRYISKKWQADENTYYKLASITKMVSGIGLMQLKERGLVDLDEDISVYFGTTIRNPRYPDTPLTLRQLMSHTSSIVDSGGFSASGGIVSEMLALESRRMNNFIKSRPGEKYHYSNFGAGLVGAIMESVTGTSVDAYMKKAVFAPLGLDASYYAGSVRETENLSIIYRNGKAYKAPKKFIAEGYEDTANPETHYRTTVGRLWMQSRDLAKLTALLCQGGELDGVRLLKEETVREMMADQAELGKSVAGPSGYGLHVERQDTIIPGVTLYGHQGTGEGMIVNTYFEPDSGFVITILTNGSSMAKNNRVGILARKLITALYPVFVQ